MRAKRDGRGEPGPVKGEPVVLVEPLFLVFAADLDCLEYGEVVSRALPALEVDAFHFVAGAAIVEWSGGVSGSISYAFGAVSFCVFFVLFARFLLGECNS